MGGERAPSWRHDAPRALCMWRWAVLRAHFRVASQRVSSATRSGSNGLFSPLQMMLGKVGETSPYHSSRAVSANPDNVNYPPGVAQCTRQLRYDPADMKRWSLVILALIVVTLSAFTVRHVRQKRAQRKREAIYESALRSYSEALKPGMTRNDVEGYLKAKNVKFTHMCCVAQHTGAFDDLTKIWQDDAPWYCS